MPQRQGLHLAQTESQVQKMSPQQLLVVRLTELPLADLEERVKNEVFDNVALEEGRKNSDDYDTGDDEYSTKDEYSDSSNDDTWDETDDYNSGSSALKDEIANYSSPDDVPTYISNRSDSGREYVPVDDTHSLIDDLRSQMSEYDLTDHQRDLVEYLIGSLNSNGFIDKPLESLADELAIYHNIDATKEEMEAALATLQQFDPAGIGARNLQESLIIQIDRLMEADEGMTESHRQLLITAKKMISKHYQLFVNKNFEKLKSAMNITDDRLRELFACIGNLNPHPGLALNDSVSDKAQTIIPDFIIESDDEGVRMWLNDGNVPELRISRDYLDQLKSYQKRGNKMSRGEQEAYAYTKQKVDSAKMFIDAIKQRRHTMYVTMKAIITLQPEFFQTLDESTLKPMILKDVADKTGLDISTVSRVCNSKYASIEGRTYPLKRFFDRARQNADGEDLDVRKIKQAIERLIEGENKSKPLPDEKIMAELNKQGLNVSRRTVAKYRSQMNIPVAKLRKKV